MYTIKNRNGEQVNEITLKPAEWCRFIGSKGGEYIITNVNGKMCVRKPLEIDEIKATKEIKRAPIYMASPVEEPAPAQEETHADGIGDVGDTIQTIKNKVLGYSWRKFICERTFPTGETNLYISCDEDLMVYFFDNNGLLAKLDVIEGYAAEFTAKNAAKEPETEETHAQPKGEPKMYTENLENNTQFETGRVYYYHFNCDYDSISYMQIVSISATRKTAIVQQLIGGKPHGEPARKKIYNYDGIEHICAGNYSMAGVWTADEWDKRELCKALDLDFMHEHERADTLAELPEMPAPSDAVYTVNVNCCDKDHNRYGETLRGVSLADMVKYVSDNANLIFNVLGEKWYIDFTLYKNGEYLCDFVTGKTTDGDILDALYWELSEKEYNAIVAAISDPDKDPDPTKPTRKPDYTAFDTSFKNTKIIAVSFGGATCSADEVETAVPVCPADKEAGDIPAPSPIDETAAKQGQDSYSFSDYKPGSATAEYNAAVAAVRTAADEVRERIPEEYRGELDKLVNRYAIKLADWTNRKNRADASCPSQFITGAANYPRRKHEKQMQRLDKLFKEYDQITALEERIKNFAYECKHRPIKAGDASAVEKLRTKVEELTALQEQMKQENAAARKRGELAPYGAYSLGNNRQNLKRYAARLAALEKAKAAPQTVSPEIKGEGFRIVRNTDIMRLQILFDAKPDECTRSLLKSNGFKWAPSQKAWQRQLTANAERAVNNITAAL